MIQSFISTCVLAGVASAHGDHAFCDYLENTKGVIKSELNSVNSSMSKLDDVSIFQKAY